MRRAARTDQNQTAIIAALRKVGAFVQPLHTVGAGCPDLLVGYRGVWRVLEVKTEKGTLTPAERAWASEAQRRAPVYVVRSAVEAVGILQLGR